MGGRALRARVPARRGRAEARTAYITKPPAFPAYSLPATPLDHRFTACRQKECLGYGYQKRPCCRGRLREAILAPGEPCPARRAACRNAIVLTASSPPSS